MKGFNAMVTRIILLGLFGAVSFGAQAQTQASDIPAKTFAQLPLMNDAELSPDGSHIAYFRPVKGSDYLIIQQLGSGTPPAAIPAYLTTPIGVEARILPTVVLPHGGPRSRSEGSFWFLTQFLVSRGYAVL